MPELYQSLSHSKWDCKYHVVLSRQSSFSPACGGQRSMKMVGFRRPRRLRRLAVFSGEKCRLDNPKLWGCRKDNYS
jgi:hypothetical protein